MSSLSRKPLRFKVQIFPSGDIAEADSPEDIVFAAKHIMRDIRENQVNKGRMPNNLQAYFYTDNKLVRAYVSRADLDRL